MESHLKITFKNRKEIEKFLLNENCNICVDYFGLNRRVGGGNQIAFKNLKSAEEAFKKIIDMLYKNHLETLERVVYESWEEFRPQDFDNIVINVQLKIYVNNYPVESNLHNFTEVFFGKSNFFDMITGTSNIEEGMEE